MSSLRKFRPNGVARRQLCADDPRLLDWIEDAQSSLVHELGGDDPIVVGDVRLNRDRVISRLAEDQDVIRECWPQPTRILLELHEQQPFRVRANRLRLRIFVDADAAVVNPSGRLESEDHRAAEVMEPDHPVARLLAGDLGDMTGCETARLRDAKQRSRQVLVGVLEFAVAADVAHVGEAALQRVVVLLVGRQDDHRCRTQSDGCRD